MGAINKVTIGEMREVFYAVPPGFYPLLDGDGAMLEVTEPGTVLVCAEKLEVNGSVTSTSGDALHVARLMQRRAIGESSFAPVKWVRVGWRLPTEDERPAVLRLKPEPKAARRPSWIGRWLQSMTLIEWLIVLAIIGMVMAVIVRGGA